jgi:DNA repair photolyase
MDESQHGPRGRGAAANPANRFTHLTVEAEEPPPDRVPTIYLRDTSRAVIARNDSPDVGFEASLNPYRGCENGCSYCYARPTHEYLGFSAGLDFETRIMVKEDAPELLRRELASPGWRPQVIAMSGVTDCYQPIERKLELTRRCLEVLAECRNPVAVITKNALVRRDADLLGELARHRAVAVSLSITTLDPELAQRMEPRASHPRRRLEAVAALTAQGIPCSVMVAPVVPGLTDHEMPAILKAAREAGAVGAGFVPLRLPGAVAGLFAAWLAEHFPDRREKVLNRIRSLRGGRLNDPNFGSRMHGEGIFAEQMRALFETACRRLGFPEERPELSTAAFRRPRDPGDPQLELFGS